VANAEIRLVNGDTLVLEESVDEAEKRLSDAARSGQSRLAWFKELLTGEPVAINPTHVASLRVSETPD
jgi:hypothetical protein